jgi:hypothetical protein
MGRALRLENRTSQDLLVQVELAGIVKTIPPQQHILIDTDFDKDEEIHLEIQADRIVVWGGVAADILRK